MWWEGGIYRGYWLRTGHWNWTATVDERFKSRWTHIATKFKEDKAHNDSTGTNADVLAAVLAKFQGNAVKPKLQCTVFSGKENVKPEFKNFQIQFSNYEDANESLPGSVKITYLPSYLIDYV